MIWLVNKSLKREGVMFFSLLEWLGVPEMVAMVILNTHLNLILDFSQFKIMLL